MAKRFPTWTVLYSWMERDRAQKLCDTLQSVYGNKSFRVKPHDDSPGCEYFRIEYWSTDFRPTLRHEIKGYVSGFLAGS